MMNSIQILVLVICFLLLSALSASTSISDVVFGQQGANDRRLLQVAKPCPVNFENQNYTIITSQCKGPDYAAKPCCDSFKEFACPVADYINDLSTDCAQVMFSYIQTIGKYPLGLFSGSCREGKEGLACPAPPPSPSDLLNDKNSGGARAITLHLLTLILSLQQFII